MIYNRPALFAKFIGCLRRHCFQCAVERIPASNGAHVDQTRSIGTCEIDHGREADFPGLVASQTVKYALKGIRKRLTGAQLKICAE